MIIKKGKFKAIINFDLEYDEYQVKFYENSKHLINADYFTDDKEEAIDTANTELERMDIMDSV